MATEEYLNKFIANGKRYHELPDRFRQTVTEDDWRRRWVLLRCPPRALAAAARRAPPIAHLPASLSHSLTHVFPPSPPPCTPCLCPRRVKDFCIARGYSWVASVANTACPEQDYYEELMRHYRAQKRVGAGVGAAGGVGGRGEWSWRVAA